ncbi:hypothetical protein SBD_0251 [Streptomyces bottropensis ATCC 25435]|uniref:Uncharacterized protein n=1 Tax=Streptomyces bottropensis ATCC 25435 TaxID=1054862 RepID=M3FZ75_9ACTN|nr:hypothetical protein SBD_0251 [Streptomyces bottropensis ATCC 25435]
MIADQTQVLGPRSYGGPGGRLGAVTLPLPPPGVPSLRLGACMEIEIAVQC